MRQRDEESAYKNWKRAMAWGERTGCHQKPERSLFIRGYQFPVCTRCLGVYIGYVLAIPFYFSLGFNKLLVLSLAGCDSMLLDWLHQALTGKESNHIRRMLTGLFGGFGIMILFMKMIDGIVRSMLKK